MLGEFFILLNAIIPSTNLINNYRTSISPVAQKFAKPLLAVGQLITLPLLSNYQDVQAYFVQQAYMRNSIIEPPLFLSV